MESTVAKAEAQELRGKMNVLKQDFADVARVAKDHAVNGTTQWVKDQPLAAIGIAAGVGFVIGLLARRK